ncbi:hypothetical protein CEXT_98231 [Caerostris extrusa]|uniref:Uncharacterized protein n=1 Tax=Caerostris extrusa TaxID=172846 RepID=A0AAV4W3A2_CAEEX|nr:hypothetical protein CEXT_98231 [Caerostris extrusa]
MSMWNINSHEKLLTSCVSQCVSCSLCPMHRSRILLCPKRIEKEEFDLRKSFVASAWGKASSESCVKGGGGEERRGWGWGRRRGKGMKRTKRCQIRKAW